MKKNLKKRLWGKMRPKKKVYKHRIQCTIHSLYGYRTDVAVILRKHMPALELGNCTTETAVVTGLPPGISAGVCASLSSVFSDQSPLLHHHFCSSSLWITHGPAQGDAYLFVSPSIHHKATLLAEGFWKERVVHFDLVSFLPFAENEIL